MTFPIFSKFLKTLQTREFFPLFRLILTGDWLSCMTSTTLPSPLSPHVTWVHRSGPRMYPSLLPGLVSHPKATCLFSSLFLETSLFRCLRPSSFTGLLSLPPSTPPNTFWSHTFTTFRPILRSDTSFSLPSVPSLDSSEKEGGRVQS